MSVLIVIQFLIGLSLVCPQPALDDIGLTDGM